MFGNLLFTLTTLSYLALCIFVLQRINTPGESLSGWGILAFGLTAIYVVFSLMLTTVVASKGGFNWLSSVSGVKNIGIGILWIGMMVGVSYCTMLRMEWHLEPATGSLRRLLTPIYFGATWLPLLMLVPYAILLNPLWRDALPVNAYKLPLIAGALLGFLILMAPSIVAGAQFQKTKINQTQSDLDYARGMEVLNRESTVKELLYFTSMQQEVRLRDAAVAKIKKQQDWEAALIEILSKKSAYDDIGVYAFLEWNKLEHPERLVEPLNNSIATLTAKIQEAIADPFKDNLGALDAGVLCRVLNLNFKDNHPSFRNNVQELQRTLTTKPATRSRNIDQSKFEATLAKYLLEVNNWLAATSIEHAL